MAKKYSPEEEQVIDDQMMRLEAERRQEHKRLIERLEDFFFDFPVCTPNDYKHRLPINMVMNLAREYTGLSISADDLIGILKARNYVHQVDKSCYPIKTYWLFGE